MNNSIKRALNYYANEGNLRRKLTLMIIPAVIFMGLISVVLTIYLKMSTVALIQAISAFAVPVIIMICGFKSKAYDTCYALICIFLSSILLPSAVLTTGGLTAGIPVMAAGSLLLCGLCATPLMRGLSFGLGIAANIAVYIICVACPDWVMPLNEDIINIHVFLSMLVTGIVLFLVGTIFIRIYDLNSRMLSVLRRHMDESVYKTLIEMDKGEAIAVETRKKGNAASTGSAVDGGNAAEKTNTSERCNTAVMFADICSFTSLSESMDTSTLAEFLNTYFEIAYTAIHDNDGVIDKYIGDCVMAFWKDEDGSGEAAVKACRAAMDMKKALKDRCSEINDRFECDLEFTAGINYGPAYVGDVGSPERKDYTAIGDTVNFAARIQEIAPKGEVYLTEAMAKIVAEKAYIAKVPKKVAIRGKCDPQDIYTLVSMEKPEATTFVMDNYHPSGYILYVCGSRGSYSLAGKRYAEFGGETSCYLFKKGNYALIVDCGSGLQRARTLIADCTDIDIVLTHLHYDHVIGLMDFNIFPKEANLRFYGNFDKWLGDESLSRLFEAPYWPVNLFRGEMISVNTEDDYHIREDIRVRFYPASHPNDANLAVVYIRDKRICVMADCENPEDLPFELVDHCDILIYDGMYEDKYYHEHIGWGHSTWESGVRLAVKANPKRLLISHHNPRNSDEKLRGLEIQAQADFPATTFAKAGDRFVL